MKNILVIGSINMDLVINTPRLPALGETITGEGFQTIPGGKGANQAMAAANLNGNVKMIGRVGADVYGPELVNTLQKFKVDTCGVSTSPTSSGIAVITVCGGDNHIILDAGANATVTPTVIDQHIDLFKWADYVLFQLEIPQETILHAAKLAHKNDAKVVLNPAPMQQMLDGILENVDMFILNEHEAALMLGSEISTIEQAFDGIKKFRNQGFDQIIITLGSNGCVFNDGDKYKHQPVFQTNVVDTTAAGDSFIGGLCVSLCEGNSLSDAIRFATAVSALTISKKGASSSLPDRADVEAFLEKTK